MRRTDRVVGGTTTEPKGLEVDSRRDREGATTQTSLGASSPSARFLSRRLGGPHAAPQHRRAARAPASIQGKGSARPSVTAERRRPLVATRTTTAHNPRTSRRRRASRLGSRGVARFARFRLPSPVSVVRLASTATGHRLGSAVLFRPSHNNEKGTTVRPRARGVCVVGHISARASRKEQGRGEEGRGWLTTVWWRVGIDAILSPAQNQSLHWRAPPSTQRFPTTGVTSRGSEAREARIGWTPAD